MTHDATTAAGRAPGAAAGSTKTLLTCGVVAGPLYVVVVVLQILTRDGFDISRHPASMLSNGGQGWIQIANFVVSGLLFVACATGLHRVLGPAARPGGTWGPRLIGAFGAGMLGAATFSADPADGFPPGTPTGPPTTMSWPAAVHFLVAGIAFLALVAACFVFARRFGATGRRAWAAFSGVTGATFLASWSLIFALQGSRPANVAFALAIALALAWASLLAAHHRTPTGARVKPSGTTGAQPQ
ncbi:DUF998 domain-containing protein [Micromonospora sp. DR5-3]|uniref:DUF998 domain-containing protein n=1 Tax=unclassified Micromonospora TaxID=2617518 RepID=UPI0011DA964C|nr:MULTISPECIES: DUF998 domain-containing protein [unclassified Micromonospora]MCW3817929.1 DUF998 domain-containing protein [Micromonospora sp. DR5-3]TYC21387.1 DUF998 domain-containing protein [Micromonospora sp. MP36]